MKFFGVLLSGSRSLLFTSAKLCPQSTILLYVNKNNVCRCILMEFISKCRTEQLWFEMDKLDKLKSVSLINIHWVRNVTFFYVQQINIQFGSVTLLLSVCRRYIFILISNIYFFPESNTYILILIGNIYFSKCIIYIFSYLSVIFICPSV